MSACAPQAWIDMIRALASYPLSVPDPLPGMSAMGSCAHSISAIFPALRITRSGLPQGFDGKVQPARQNLPKDRQVLWNGF